MKQFELNALKRAELGKKPSKTLRDQHNIPCVMYGGKENLKFSINQADARTLLYTPNVYVVNLNIEGSKHLAIFQDVQTHPVTDLVIHIDFKEVFEDKPIVISVPFKVTGNSIGVRKGGKLRVFKRYVKVKGLPKHIPDEVVIDTTDLDISKSVRIGNLKYDNVSFVENANEQLVGVFYARTVVEETPAAGVAAPAEGAAAAPAAAATPAAAAPAKGAAAKPAADAKKK